MTNSLYLNKQHNTDVEIVQFGWQECEKKHFFGPAVRDHFLIHFVVGGKGIFKSGDKVYSLKKGDGFLICPKQLTYYEADAENPWEYIWIGFTGVKAQELLRMAGLSEKKPVFSDCDAERIFKNMVEAKGKKAVEMVLLSEFYNFIAMMSQKSEYENSNPLTISEQYVANAIQYIKNNYIHNINISLIAGNIGLNRSYFYEIFKKQTGVSPQQFLIAYRIEKACGLLKDTNLRISDIARSVGYDDEFLFTRMFTKKMGQSPSKYKKTFTV